MTYKKNKEPKSAQELLDETYQSMAVLARLIEQGNEDAQGPWEKLNEHARLLENEIGASLQNEYEQGEKREVDALRELLDRVDEIVADGKK